MKRSLILIIFVISIALTIQNISSLSTLELKFCKNICVSDKKDGLSICNNDFNSCKSQSKTIFNSCLTLTRQERYDCLKNFNIEDKKCSDDKRNCIKNNEFKYSVCINKCIYSDKNITCGNYNAGDRFLNSCNVCDCSFHGKISCKSTEYCNFIDNSLTYTKEVCESNNGLYQELCAGTIQSTKCVNQKFCQCGGTLNLGCPGDSICLYDFSLNKNRVGQFKQDWVKFPQYQKIGNVGICVKKPILSTCGNSICDNICKDLDCSNAETSYNCPEDCK